MTTPPKAVVVGATNGIGKACANHLAGAGFNVIAVGRDRPGRAESIVKELNEKSPPSNASPLMNFELAGGRSTVLSIQLLLVLPASG